jgi:hypothetical protein
MVEVLDGRGRMLHSLVHLNQEIRRAAPHLAVDVEPLTQRFQS